MKKLTTKCPECNEEFTGKTEIGLKRIVTAHLRYAHGVAGVTATPEGRRLNENMKRYMLKGMSQEEAESKAREQLKKYREKHGAPIQPLKLEECPRCHLAFLGRQADGKACKLELDNCPNCDIRFYYSE